MEKSKKISNGNINTNMLPVQDLEQHIQHHVHHKRPQPNHNQDVVDSLEAILVLASVCLIHQTSDQLEASQESTLKLDLEHKTNLTNTGKTFTQNSHKRPDNILPSNSYLSVFFSAFIAFDLSAKCTKPILFFSCPDLAGGRTTFVIFPWCSKSFFNCSWVTFFGRFLTYTAFTCSCMHHNSQYSFCLQNNESSTESVKLTVYIQQSIKKHIVYDRILITYKS